MDKIKKIYKNKFDGIFDGRFNSQYKIRKYAHRTSYNSLLKYLDKDMRVLDAGCGDGVLSFLISEVGVKKIVACDISKPNIKKAKERLSLTDKDNLEFIEADLENLPFPDDSFDLVICSHVLEHLPDFNKGISEIHRVSKNKVIIALPNCLNLCSFALLGHDNFWIFSKRSPFSMFWGFLRVLFNIFKEGVDENYGGNKELPHIRRYPWVITKKVERAGFNIIKKEASSLCLPYFNFLLPIGKFLDKFKSKKFLSNLGLGFILICNKNVKKN